MADRKRLHGIDGDREGIQRQESGNTDFVSLAESAKLYFCVCMNFQGSFQDGNKISY